jgi:hypothetical protein
MIGGHGYLFLRNDWRTRPKFLEKGAEGEFGKDVWKKRSPGYPCIWTRKTKHSTFSHYDNWVIVKRGWEDCPCFDICSLGFIQVSCTVLGLISKTLKKTDKASVLVELPATVW